MKKSILFVLIGLFTLNCYSQEQTIAKEERKKENIPLSEKHCTTSFEGLVNTYMLEEKGIEVGKSIWISRKGGRVKAKYFAHKQNGYHVHHRYTTWRVNDGKNIILKSSGTYATSWNNSDLPVGVTADNGVIVNRDYSSKMDGLVIVYATGGIAVSNIEDGDLFLTSLNKKVDITNYSDRAKFLKWAEREDVTVFQTHLLAYKNKIEISKNYGSGRTARRQFLTLVKDENGEIFHVIFYLKDKEYSLYDGTTLVLEYLKHKKYNTVAMLNLESGGAHILNTAGEATDCNGNNLWGTSNNYDAMANLFTYYIE